jgi:hypothetical protein
MPGTDTKSYDISVTGRFSTKQAELAWARILTDALQLLVLLLLCTGVLTVACYAQNPTAGTSSTGSPDVMKIVRDASYNEMHAMNQGHPYRYLMHSIDDGKSTSKEIYETKDGDMKRLLASNHRPLTPEQNAAELKRLDHLRADPDEQARQHKKSKANDARDNEMLELLPKAFLFTYAGMVPGPNGPCYRLRFEPNPAYQPPDRQGEVYHGMAGELWVDKTQQRMVRFDAHLITDVDFGWGIFGQLYKGGTILVEQKDVGDHHWENTLTRLNLTGKILMVKALTIDSTDEASEFYPVPDAGYQAAIDYLKTMPVPQE